MNLTPIPLTAPGGGIYAIDELNSTHGSGQWSGINSQVIGYVAGTDQKAFSVTPFPGFEGELRVAKGDVNGDGVPDVIVAAGTGGGPHVVVYDGKTGNILYNFFAFEPSFTGGSVCCGGRCER